MITQGSRGVSTSLKNGEVLTVPARKAQVVETTGAGDTLNGAFSVQIAAGRDIESALVYANTAASLSTEKFGAQTGMPTAEEVERELNLVKQKEQELKSRSYDQWQNRIGVIKMKRNGILNADISRVLSYMGHTDRICIGDCGLPIPEETERIDLAVKFGQPSFMDVLKEVGVDMKVEKIVLAEEIKEQNPQILNEVSSYFAQVSGNANIAVEFVPHTQLKKMTKECKAVIRTGETTPYANIILQSGCIFG